MKIRKVEGEELQKKAAAVLHRAFTPSKYEEKLVESLRKNGKTILEWVAIHRNMVIGYIAFTPAYRDGEQIGLHLAPIAVHPDFQKNGVGTELMQFALRQAEIKEQDIFVLGKPHFYERFGFRRTDRPLCPFTKNNKNFMIKGEKQLDDYSVGYEKEFSTTK